jgi:release factor glutamine methyltransferase
VRDWEPVEALVPGPSGLEAYEVLLVDVGSWLAPGGAFVAEIGAGQGPDVAGLAASAGLDEVRVVADHAGLDRAIVAVRHG